MKPGILIKAQTFVIKHAPTILTVAGAVGTVVAVYLSSDAALKAQDTIENIEKEAKGDDYELYSKCKAMAKVGYKEDAIAKKLDIPEDKVSVIKSPLSKADTAAIYLKSYAPTLIVTTASIFCMFSANHINKKRIAQLAGAYLMSEKALKEYKDKAKEVVGVKKAQEITDEIVQDHINANPASVANIDTPAMTNSVNLSLWYDVISDRYFYSNAEYIRKAELEAQKLLEKNGFVSVNDVYGMLGLRDIPLGNNGWQKSVDKKINSEVSIEIGGALDEAGNPIGTITMNIDPDDTWLGEI